MQLEGKLILGWLNIVDVYVHNNEAYDNSLIFY